MLLVQIRSGLKLGMKRECEELNQERGQVETRSRRTKHLSPGVLCCALSPKAVQTRLSLQTVFWESVDEQEWSCRAWEEG